MNEKVGAILAKAIGDVEEKVGAVLGEVIGDVEEVKTFEDQFA